MKRFLSFSFIFIYIFTTIFTFNTLTVKADTNDSLWPDGPSISGKTAVVIDADTGTILYQKKPNKKMYPASITKILTCLLTLENCDMDEMVTFSHLAVYSLEYGDAHIGLQEGEEISVKDCLYGLMLASANEVAYGLAEHISGSFEDFATLMNERAKEAGATNSNFVNPNGLQDENHYTTAYDMALITKAAVANPDFLEIVGTKTYTIDETEMTDEKRYLANYHRMLYDYNTEYDEDVIGGKTGYTEEAGNTLVTIAKRDGMTLICVVLNSTSIYEDTRTLLDYSFDNYQLSAIDESQIMDSDGNCALTLGSKYGDGTMSVSYDSGKYLILPNDADPEDVTCTYEYPDDGDIAAIATYYYGDRIVGSANILYEKVPEKSTTKSGFFSKKSTSGDSGLDILNSTMIKMLKIMGIILLVVILVCIALALRVAKIKKIRREKRRRYLERKAYEQEKRRRRERDYHDDKKI